MNKDSLQQMFERKREKLREKVNHAITLLAVSFLEVEDVVKSRDLGEFQIALEKGASHALEHRFASICSMYVNDLIKLLEIKGEFTDE